MCYIALAVAIAALSYSWMGSDDCDMRRVSMRKGHYRDILQRDLPALGLRMAIDEDSASFIFQHGEKERNDLPPHVCASNRLRLVRHMHDKMLLAQLNLTEADGVPESIPLPKMLPAPQQLLEKVSQSNHPWICKDAKASGGALKYYFNGTPAGVASLLSWRNGNYDHIVQRLVNNPMMMNGKKFSLRAYVVVLQTGADENHIHGFIHDIGQVCRTAADFDANVLSDDTQTTNLDPSQIRGLPRTSPG